MSRLRPHLTYANVMSSIAVFAALTGGVAWAHGKIGTQDLRNGAVTTPKLGGGAVTAPKLRDNAVRTHHIQDGAVNSDKVLDGSLTGEDIDESSLGQVPSATNSDQLGGVGAGQYARKGSDGWTSLELHHRAQVFPTQRHCRWENYGGGYSLAAYFRDPAGVVHLRGLVKLDELDGYCDPSLDADRIIVRPHPWQLEPGYRRDAHGAYAVVSNNQAARVNVLSSGHIQVEPGFPTLANAKQWVSLEGISWRCAPSGENGCP